MNLDFILNTVLMIPMTMVYTVAIANLISFPRRNKWLFIFVYPIFASGLRLLMVQYDSPLNQDLVQTVIMIALPVLMSNDKLSYRIFAVLIQMMVQFFIDPIGALIFSSMGGEVPAGTYTSYFATPGAYAFVRVVLFLIYIALAYVVNVIWNKLLKKSGEWTLLLFSLFPISQGLLCWCACDVITVAGGNQKQYMTLCLLMLGAVVADAAMIWSISRLRQMDETKQRAAFLAQQLSQQEIYYEHVKQEAETTAQIRHDLRNQIQTAYALIGDGDSETAITILDELNERISSMVYYCENRVVNAIMNEKTQLCRESGIDITSNLAVKQDVGIKEIDLCSIFANIMDNAIGGCHNCETAKPKIELSAKQDKGYLVVKCRNSAGKPPTGIRARQSLSEHGWGLTILSELASRYDGNLNTDFQDSVYETTVFVKC